MVLDLGQWAFAVVNNRLENPFGDVSTSATFYFIIRLQIISQIEKQPAAGSSGQSSLFCFTYADQTFIAAILRETAK